ncbi:carboxymuconolactone decarboxylase family protein [Roseibium sp. MMSF_3544]|uniref:carboxymuconolactone decarboxylase family protein n=1 Tax=unclassified Roseibium TaxID=2629323 RepID=UPI00274013B7|nr:carboxymuconolactone decarboxylase family protein [Roseibium sp. MMSF_3544]
MQRLPKIERENISGEFDEFYGAVTQLLGRVPNFYRTISHAPWYVMLLLGFNASVQRQWPGSRMSGRIKELMVIKTSHTNGCNYCYAHNTALGQAAGITHEEIIELSSDDYLQSETLSPGEKVAVRWAEAVTKNTAAGDDALFEEMKKHFTNGEIVELTMVSAMFNMINRLNDSLAVPIELEDEINLIKRSLDMDPAKVGTYLHWLADFWPEDAAAFQRMNAEAEKAATWET